MVGEGEYGVSSMEYRRKTWGNVTHERPGGSVDQRADISRGNWRPDDWLGVFEKEG
jgi:hypothetical protein